MATWSAIGDATARAADPTIISELKKANPETVALAIDHQTYKTQGTATPFSAFSGEINGIINTFNSEIATAERLRIDNLNTANQKAADDTNALNQSNAETTNDANQL